MTRPIAVYSWVRRAGLSWTAMTVSFTQTGEQDIGHIGRKRLRRLSATAIWELFPPVSQREQHDLLLLGRAIREIREERDVTAADLAGATEVELAQIRALEAGRVDPTYELLLALAEGLGVRPSAFVIRAEALATEDRAGEEGSTRDR
jgi:DNA-binding XRE family transcriptional regulator